MTQAVSRQFLSREVSVYSHGSACGVCGRYVITATGFPWNIPGFPVNYYATTAPIFIGEYI
jgi:hypothetical protein